MSPANSELSTFNFEISHFNSALHMADPDHNKAHRAHFKNNFLYLGLFFYCISLLAIDPGSGKLDRIRIPSFALLLLFLVQVIFPNFRFSKLSNFRAIFIIIFTAFIASHF